MYVAGAFGGEITDTAWFVEGQDKKNIQIPVTPVMQKRRTQDYGYMLRKHNTTAY